MADTGSQPVVVVACSVFRPELEALRASGRITVAVEYVDSCLHMSPQVLRAELARVTRRHRTAGRRVVYVYGDCHAWMEQQGAEEGVCRVAGRNCAMILLGPERYEALAASGTFFLMPEWASRWREIIGAALGGDALTNGALLRDLHTRFVYLDTGAVPVPGAELDAMRAELGLPVEVEEAGLEPLAGAVEAALSRCQRECPTPEPAIQLVLLDLIEEVLASAGSPAGIGPFVTDRLRELTGSQAVSLIACEHSFGGTGHRALSVCPERRRAMVESREAARLVALTQDAGLAVLWLSGDSGEAGPCVEALGLEAAIGVPLRVGPRMVGTVLLLGLPDLRGVGSVLQLLDRLAPLVALALRHALLFERQEAIIAERTTQLARSREEEARFRDALAELHAVTLRLSSAATGDELWRAAIALGQGRLGFPRLSVWLCGQSAEEVVGTYGVGETGNLRDERAMRLRVTPASGMGRVLRGLEPAVAEHDVPLLDHASQVVGHGLAIKAALWDGSDVVGCLCVDDLLAESAWPAYQTELARLYAQSLGSLWVRIREEERRRELESQLQQAQRLETVGVLAGGIAHDFNNILAAVMGFGEMALDEVGPGTTAASHLKHVLAGTNRAKDLVQRILTFSRQAPMEQRPLLLQALLSDVLRFMRASLPSTVEISQTIDPETPAVRVDPTQMHQVIVNLCTNAEHAMRPKGGVLSATLGTAELGPEQTEPLGGLPPGTYVVLSISDTGGGMDAATRERVFEPFFTTKPVGEGTGLGLATSYGIVVSHGGAIAVESEVGVGSSFKVYLPALGESVARTPAADEAPPTGAGRVLFVDDEPELASIGESLLTSLGYTPIVFRGSEEALRAFVSDPSGFDLILTDQTMPRVTGLDLTAEVRKTSTTIPIIIMTGFSSMVTPDAQRELGIHAVLPKPYTKRQLGEVIRRAMNEGGGPG